jgi:uncharacterized protein YgiM (DUF1202 family)
VAGNQGHRPWPGFRELLALLILPLVCACAARLAPAPPAPYYVTPALTYLRDAPKYEGNVLAQLYRGEQVERLDVSESDPGWWRVRTRTGQTGWVQGELLSPNPLPVTYLYVAVTSVPLRECPEEACSALQLVYGGDRVQALEENQQGWVWVLVEKGRTLGWLPQKVLAEKPPVAQPRRPEKPYAYVAVPRLKLRLSPGLKAPVIKILTLNDQVERLEVNPGGWARVRQPVGGALGWVQGRYLEPLPVQASPRATAGQKKKPKAPEKTEEDLQKPEIM